MKLVSKNKENFKEETNWVRELIAYIIFALLVVVPVHSFAYKPYKIPSESMLNNLMVGDYILVSKVSYGYSKHSLPFSVPLIEGRLFASDVERGDVVVFRLPRDFSTYYIKRIIGLPGDKLQTIEGKLYLNDEKLETHRLEDYVRVNELGSEERFKRYSEVLPSGRSHKILDIGTFEGSIADNSNVYTVPEGHYFALGDNRDNSLDSRWPSHVGVGFIPKENVVGQAKWITLSFDNNAKFWEIWKWFPEERRQRFFSEIN